MKLYCYYFKMDGTVEKKEMECRKEKDKYVFKCCDDEDFSYDMCIPLETIGKPLGEVCEDGVGCRMFLDEDEIISEEMIEFSRFRAQKIRELNEIHKRTYEEIRERTYEEIAKSAQLLWR